MLQRELSKWKNDSMGAQALIDQLTEKVRQLEKLESQIETSSSMAKEHGKMKEKVETIGCKFMFFYYAI